MKKIFLAGCILISALTATAQKTIVKDDNAVARTLNAPFHAARKVLEVKGIPYEDTRGGIIVAVKKLCGTEKPHLSELAEKISKYADGCESCRDDKKGDVERPTLLIDVLYPLSYKSLTALSHLIR